MIVFEDDLVLEPMALPAAARGLGGGFKLEPHPTPPPPKQPFYILKIVIIVLSAFPLFFLTFLKQAFFEGLLFSNKLF